MEKIFKTEEENELLTVDGVIESVIYRNSENGYSVCDLETEGGELITVVGNMPFIAEGEIIRAMGKWFNHPSFGRQFKIEYMEKQLPVTSSAIQKYLASGAVKGIGPKLASKIVGKYGADSFDVIENHPEWLSDLPGISQKKAQEMSESFKEQFGIRAVMMFCRDFFGPETSIKIFKRWGAGAVDVIKDNPYLLCDEIYGVGFERADKIADSLGFDKSSPERIKAGVKCLLGINAIQEGHVFIPRSKVIAATAQMLSVSEDSVIEAVDALLTESKLTCEKIGSKDAIYLTQYNKAEKYIAHKLDMLDKLFPKFDLSDIDRFITQIELENNIQYDIMQKKAIENSLNSGVMILTGGPGTGKTTVIKAVISAYERIGLRVALAAPTGRAAKRMSEATGHDAKTIHRMLEFEYTSDGKLNFKRNENDILEEDAIIIDEASMVDVLLMEALLKATKPGARIMIIGDADQLPSVGAGNILNDLIECERFNTIKLKEIFRQAQESLIITNAHMINHGEYPELDAKSGDFFFINRTDDESIAKTIVDLCLNRLPKKYGEDIKDNIQVITPSRKGAAGTESLNSVLQKYLNPKKENKKEVKYRDKIFRVGDKVMQIKNNYDITWEKNGVGGVGIFNGDIGTVEAISLSDETMMIDFDGREAEYDFSMLDELDHAYAITVHKSQGSEYSVVILPVYNYTPKLLTRNLLYTAVTRAQDMAILVGRPDVIMGMVNNNRITKRYTGLKQFLYELDK